MIIDGIYNYPTCLWGSALVCGTTLLACLGLVAFRQFTDVKLCPVLKSPAGFTIATISVVYAALLALSAIATWEAFSSAKMIVHKEAAYLGNLYRDTQGSPERLGEPMRKVLKDYAESVVQDEWPMQQKGQLPDQDWKPLYELHQLVVGFDPKTRGEAVIQAEFLRTLNQLYKVRESRLVAAAEHLPAVIWWIIATGGALTTGFTFLFGFESFRLHLTMTAAVAASLSLVVVLIVALDWPFRGEVSLSPKAYIDVEHGWAVGVGERD